MSESKLSTATVIATGAMCCFLLSCGPKKGEEHGPETPGSGKPKGAKTVDDRFLGAIDALNKAIQEGNQAAFEDLIAEPTMRLLADIVAFSPAENGGVKNPTTVDFMDFEKQNKVTYELLEYDEAAGEGKMLISSGEEDSVNGPVVIELGKGKTTIHFEELAQQRLEKIQSEGILRSKFEKVIDNINDAVGEKNGQALKENITIDSLNLELEVRAFTVKHKKNLNLQFMADSWNRDEVLFEISEIDTTASTGKLKVASPDETLYEGSCGFITEIGKLKLDFTDILKAKKSELLAQQSSKKKKKKGK
ncbi:MAG: hypothetical protein ABIJ56_02720 [Pseudomonadota bacterium]